MPHHLTCPKCQAVGSVRAERIITKQGAITHYLCARCAEEWERVDPPPEPTPPER